jgi:hypothetical protein
VKVEILQAADIVTQPEVEAAARGLWERALARPAASSAAAHTGGPSPPAEPAEPAVSAAADAPTEASAARSGSATAAAEAVEDLLVEKPVADTRIVLPRDITEYAFTEDEVYVVGTNGRKVTVIAGLEYLASTLTTLVLRSHVIGRMEGLRTLVHLTKLELYDNQIEELEELGTLRQLVVLDMSYNSIRSMVAPRESERVGARAPIDFNWCPFPLLV